jgi:hypothetical protein
LNPEAFRSKPHTVGRATPARPFLFIKHFSIAAAPGQTRLCGVVKRFFAAAASGVASPAATLRLVVIGL